MGTLVDILSRHREELKERAEWQRHLLAVFVLASAFTGAVGLYTWLMDDYPLPIAQDFFNEHKNLPLSIANFCVATALGATFRIWRMRQTRIKTLIAEAFLMEGETDTALRLILELQLGDTAWLNEQLRLLAASEMTKV